MRFFFDPLFFLSAALRVFARSALKRKGKNAVRQGRNQRGCCRTPRNGCATGFASVLVGRGTALAEPVAPSPVAAKAALHLKMPTVKPGRNITQSCRMIESACPDKKFTVSSAKTAETRRAAEGEQRTVGRRGSRNASRSACRRVRSGWPLSSTLQLLPSVRKGSAVLGGGYRSLPGVPLRVAHRATREAASIHDGAARAGSRAQ